MGGLHVATAEEIVLNLPNNSYPPNENIGLHEFAHNIMNVGLTPQLMAEIARDYSSAVSRGLFSGVYAGSNAQEYWAVGTQIFFDATDQYMSNSNAGILTRAQLMTYDPLLFATMTRVFSSDEWRPGRFLGNDQNNVFSGTSHDDYVFAGGGDDRFDGSAGNDFFFGGAGNDLFEGGAGLDTFQLSSRRTDYQVTNNSGSLTVQNVSGTRADAVDTLSGVERLQFSDAILAFDVDGNAGNAYRLYQAAFDRVPDQAGLSFWTHQLDLGLNIFTVAQGFVNAAEFHSVYGANPTNTHIVDLMYQNVLGRAGEPAGIAFWVGQLDRSLPVGELLQGFATSSENHGLVDPVLVTGITLNSTALLV